MAVELDLAPPELDRAAFTSGVAATMRFAALDEEISASVPSVLTPAAKK